MSRFVFVVIMLILVTFIITEDKKEYVKASEHNFKPIAVEEKTQLQEAELIQIESEPKKISLGEYTLTAYCSCQKCCGKWALNRPKDENGNDIVYGASGARLVSGYSVACPLPFGTMLEIDGKQYEVQDRTAEYIAERYNDKIIDVYFAEHEQAVEFGKRTAEVYEVTHEDFDNFCPNCGADMRGEE